MIVQQNIDAEGERNTWAAWKAYVFDRHPLATWVTAFTVFMVIYCFVLLPMLESGFGLRMAKTLAILMAVPCAGVLIWQIVDGLRSEKQGLGRYLLRSSPGSGPNVSNSGDQALEEPTIKNPFAALAAGFSALAQQRRSHKRLIRKAVRVPGKEYLDYYDTFEEYVKKGDLQKAYQKLKVLLNPRNYPVAKHALYEVYSQVLEDEAFFPLLKAWFKPLPDEKLFRVGLMCLFSDNGEDARICFKKLHKREKVDFEKQLVFALTVHHIAENEGMEEGAWLDLAAQYWREYGQWVLETERRPRIVKTMVCSPKHDPGAMREPR